MALQDKATLKSYFQTGDVPTEAQFVDLIDSTHNGELDDAVALLEPAVAALQSEIIKVVNGNGGADLTIARPDTAAPVYWWNFGGRRPNNATDIDIIAGGPSIVDNSSASVSLLPEWDGAILRLSNAAPTLTIPANATTAFPSDYRITIVSDNQWTLVAASGVALNGATAPTSREAARPCEVTLVRDDSNTWTAVRTASKGRYPTGNIPGWFVAPWGLGQNANTGTLAPNAIYGSLFEIVIPTTVDQIVVRSGTGNTTGDQADLAIYAVSGSVPLPTGAPLWSSGAVAMAAPTTNATVTVSPSLVLMPGLYFFAHNQNVSRAFFTRRGSQAQALLSRINFGSSANSGFFGASGSSFRRDGVTFGTWPTLTGATTDWTQSNENFDNMAQLVLRCA